MKIEKMLQLVQAGAEECSCGQVHNPLSIETMIVGRDALSHCASYLNDKKFEHALIIADQHTFRAAGEKLQTILSVEGMQISTCFIEPNKIGDVVADEVAIVQALLHIHDKIDVLLAVGSGTIHDITRFCSAKTGRPFVSIPTAASVDGFTSLGAPLIVRGIKQTYQTVSPIALFGDIQVLMDAPREMTAAGFGDMLAKFTSLTDWSFGQLIKGEPYCPYVANLTREALYNCVDHVDEIAAHSEEGIKSLMGALIQSGLAMLVFGQSHPASGGEHHLSHYWEMRFLKENKQQVLHGAKVGVSSILLARLYRKWFDEEQLMAAIGADLYNRVGELIYSIPDPSVLKSYLEKVGGPTKPEVLGVEQALVEKSLQEAHKLRDRYTILKCYNSSQQ